MRAPDIGLAVDRLLGRLHLRMRVTTLTRILAVCPCTQHQVAHVDKETHCLASDDDRVTTENRIREKTQRPPGD